MYELQNSDANTALNFFGENQLKKSKKQKIYKKYPQNKSLPRSAWLLLWIQLHNANSWLGRALMGQGSYGLPEEVFVHIEDRAIGPTIAEGP